MTAAELIADLRANRGQATSGPFVGRPVLILDCGANVDQRPEWLVQFACMGAAYMEAVHGVERPEEE